MKPVARKSEASSLWHMSARWTHGHNQPPQPPPLQISPQWVEQRDIRKEYREERESELLADLEASKTAEQSAVAMAQMVIKSGFILNGGGIIAIPAIVSLFNLDAEKLLHQLIVTGGLFIGGLCSACAASIFGFFALAHKADLAYSNAIRTARIVQGKYFPLQAQEMAVQAATAQRRSNRLRILFIVGRYVAILLCLISVGLFIAGAVIGGTAVLNAPHKATQIMLPSGPAPLSGSN